MKNPKKPKNAEAPCITAIAKDTAFIWVRNGKKGKPTQKAVERGFRVRFKSIEIGSSKNKDVHVYIQGKAWSTPFDERLLSGEVRHTPSKIKTVWVLPREWCWVVGRGIVHEADDIRPDNPPSNPADAGTVHANRTSPASAGLARFQGGLGAGQNHPDSAG